MRARLAQHALLALVAGLLAGPVGLLAGPAAALQVSPADRELARAREAQSEAASAVMSAESRLAAVSARLDQLAISAAKATEAHNGAQYALQQARGVESEAVAEAARAMAAARDATAELGRVAATAYRSGGQLGLVAAVLDADRSEQFVGGAAVLQTVIRSEGTIADHAMEASDNAEDAAEGAQRARRHREEAARAAELAAVRAAAAVAELETQLAALERERDRALAELAAARGTTIALEQERQARLALSAPDERVAEPSRQDAGAAESTGGTQDQNGEPPDAPAVETQPPAADPVVSPSVAPSPTEPSAVPASSRPEPASPTASPRPQTIQSADSSAADPPAKTAPAPTSGAQRAIDYARAQLGKPYEWGAAGPGSFDCSGLTMRAWQQAGVSLPHWSVAQARMVTRVSYTQLRPGDLIFWSDNGQASGTYHVGLYTGAGKMIHAPRPGKVVEIQNVFYWRPPSFYGRV